MTIRRRLTLAFVAILALFAVTQAVQFWSARLRDRSMATVDRALKRQVVMSELTHRVDDLQKQVALLSQMEDVGDMPEARAFFDEQLAKGAANIQLLKSLSGSDQLAAVTELEQTYAKLAEAWRQFYEYLSKEPGWAVAFQVRAEPLRTRVLTTMLPALVKQQQALADDAEARFASVSTLTQRINLGIFGLSMCIAVAIAYFIARSLTRPLGELKLGASLIGSMRLDHRIEVRSRDEIGLVAHAFNDMAESLSDARQQLTLANDELVGQNQEVERQRQAVGALLHNILPSQIAAELAAEGKVAPRYFEEVTILFTDFVGFTVATEQLAAEELVECLHEYFTAFDRIVARYGIEKLKTIGDSYMCAGGLPVRTPSHPVDTVLAAFEMIDAVAEQGRRRPQAAWGVRIGIHTGPVIAGVVGIQKFAFDVWGDTVNYASRMESSGANNRINLSAETARRVKDFFDIEPRGKVATKDKRDLEMFFAKGALPVLVSGGGDGVAPDAFLKRYRTYFERDPPAFPDSQRPDARPDDSTADDTAFGISGIA